MGKAIFLIIVVLALVGAVYYLFGDLAIKDREKNESGAGNGTASGPVVSGGAAGNLGGGSGGGASQDPEGVAALWYYNDTHADRYDAFAVGRPELSMEDVVWMVEVDLDKEPYVEVQQVPDPQSLTLLVNKHYFLPESFVPDLVAINNTMMHPEAVAAMNEMIDAASAEGHRLWVQSGFRSYSIQASLYQKYSASDGVDKADTYSARPGHSEHQSGLTADLNTISDAFGNTPEGRWAAENCWKYGFIVRYTEENMGITLYKPEPWHVRYVGEGAADLIHELGILSYEEYWVKYVKYPPQSLG